MTPPMDRAEYWIRFVCAFIVFGAITALFLLRYTNTFSAGYLATTLLFTVLISIYAARTGDEAWHRIVNFFRWW